MADAERWKRKIQEIDDQRSRDRALSRDMATHRLAHLRTVLAEYERRLEKELAAFAQSEEARFMQHELGRPSQWKCDGRVPSNQGMVPSKKYHPPSNVLPLFDLLAHKDDVRVFGFSGYGLTEFYRSVSFWIGLSVPARSWAYGDGMSGTPVSAGRFATSYMKARFPSGPDSVGIVARHEPLSIVSATASAWDALSFDEWTERLPISRDSEAGLVERVRVLFSGFIERR